jgi:hypothetical protein
VFEKDFRNNFQFASIHLVKFLVTFYPFLSFNKVIRESKNVVKRLTPRTINHKKKLHGNYSRFDWVCTWDIKKKCSIPHASITGLRETQFSTLESTGINYPKGPEKWSTSIPLCNLLRLKLHGLSSYKKNNTIVLISFKILFDTTTERNK